MMEQDTTSRFDRRSMIKKGLVGAGIAATVPVISTFETAAFAASVPGCHGKQYSITGNTTGTIVATEVTPTVSTTCDPSGGGCTWSGTISTAPTVTASVNQATDVVTFTLTGSYASCEFVGGTAQRVSGSATCQNPMTGAVFGSNTVSWTKPDNQDWVIRLLVLC